MNKTVSCVLFLAVCLTLVGSSFGEIVVGNAEFEDVPIASGSYTYVIYPWICDNIGGGADAWVSNGYYPEEPEPQTPILFPEGNIVYQPLSAIYQEGGIYTFSIDIALWYADDDWEIFFYDATSGDHLTHLASLASTDPGEEPLPTFFEWYRKSVMFTATALEVNHRIGIGLSGGPWTMFDNAVVETTAGDTDSNTSRAATLSIKKMVGWWKLDETEGTVAADSSPEGGDNSGTVETLIADPNNVWSPDGIIDGALDCDGLSTWVDTHKFAADLGIEGNSDRSVSAWVYTRGFNNGGIFDVGARVTAQDFGLRTLSSENQWRIQYWSGDMDFTYPSKDTWVHFVHTHGPEGTKIYADGQMIVDWPGKVLDTGDDFTFRIGHYGPDNQKFNGLIDDVQLYNYVLEPLEVANLYLEGKPDGTICLSNPPMDFTGPDGVPDCIVDLYDFAQMASEFMRCNFLPDCNP